MHPCITPAERLAHSRSLLTLKDAGIPALVGGAYAMFHYTGMSRYTKDLDIFLRREDEAEARRALLAAGYRTELTDPIWLSKAFWGDILIDIIFSSGNGLANVDDDWFANAPKGNVLGVPSEIVPPEEMIWTKAFVQERERWDGADVAHIIRSSGSKLDWRRLMDRFDPHWQVLLAHLSLFSFTYPTERDIVPRWVWRTLLQRAEDQTPESSESKICRGTLLSRKQYEVDVGLWGYRDAREVEVPAFHGLSGEPAMREG